MVKVRTIDESTLGSKSEGPTLSLPSADVTVRDLISFRVENEVDRFNRERGNVFHGLIQPSDAEERRNGKKGRSFRPIDARAQIEIALRAFEKGRIIVLTRYGQAGSLEETVSLFDGDEVSFLRLVPLVGG